MNLVQWRADDTHFPRLERLIIRKCFKLEEIPCSIGNIPTLQIIELDDASPSAVTSAEQIQEEQEQLGNDSLQVHVNYRFQPNRLRAIEQFRKSFLCDVYRDPMKEVVSGVAPRLLEFLNRDGYPQLQKEAALAISTISQRSHPPNRTNGRINIAIKQFRESFEDVHSRDPMREVVSGVVPRLLEFLYRDGYPQLQKEAALAISMTISSHPLGRTNDRINILIDHGAIPILLSLLRSPDDDLCEEALHLLGDFSFASTKSCDLIISYGGCLRKPS
ncbi:unnamed protein product [Fraxinus pennsylvanica]|uniref:Uncharacterized protein n=1 Tax=Fraxinus pennsylvanica TaxID=56036 RepID=A0AAD1ZZZ1_9LAMI|nr:unnamed protein product [Fraxinus pennsylvanica]